MKFIPHKYQSMAIEKIYNTPRCGLFLDMGLGKTVITLTAIEDLIYNQFEISKVLVIAPLRVAEDTWSRECEKWDHLKDLSVVKILGSPRKRRLALAQEADVYIFNRENFVARRAVAKSWPRFMRRSVASEVDSTPYSMATYRSRAKEAK